MKRFCVLLVACVSICHVVQAGVPAPQAVTIITGAQPASRALYGVQQISAALKKAGYLVTVSSGTTIPAGKKVIVAALAGDAWVKKAAAAYTLPIDPTGKEGFSIYSVRNIILIAGADASGVLYGCLELADRIKTQHQLPAGISVKQQPEMVLRGACIGVQKPYYLPGRTVYEYPYTEETFPWLYDRDHWIKYLDSLAANRMNSLYLWNGHPFASLVRLKDYPYAVEVDDATFKKNEELFKFLAQETDRRGIWLIQMFYNIIVSKPFAEKHQIKSQDRNRPIIPMIADYTRKSIAAFVAKYPNVGLMVCLGEAMEGVGQMDVEWFTKTIIPGVQDGLKMLGKKEEPPIVLRAHDTDAPSVMKAALPVYKNLYTEAKYNGEALTTYTPRGPWAELHRTLSRIGTVQIENVHIMANLEPFRYGSPDFIQKCVLAMHQVYEANGLHLYPQASYWDWPYTADNTAKRLLQIDRDWIWYKAWARYAWNCHRDRAEEITYWCKELANKYGCTTDQAKYILDAYEEAGEISPKLLRRYGITDGNRQTMTLGMFMTQLINPRRYGLFTLLYNSEGPEGEMIIEFAEKEFKKQPHVGETPPQVAAEVVEHGRKAVEAIEKAAAFVKTDKAEFDRLKNDMYCYKAMAEFYAAKARAAVQVLKYKYSNNVADLEPALPMLQESVDAFERLAGFTKDSYLYANSMQTQQRKIPIGGNDGKNKTWVELLPFYEKELQNFKKHIDSLKTQKPVSDQPQVVQPLPNARVQLAAGTGDQYDVQKGAVVFADTNIMIGALAKELAGLKAIRLAGATQRQKGTTIRFTTDAPVKLLVGYFAAGKDTTFAPAPQLETDASANDYGQAEPVISNAVLLEGMPPVNIHTYSFKAGSQQLALPRGRCLILGFIPATASIPVYDAGLQDLSFKQIDWLFE